MLTRQPRVLIVGAGIAGPTLAYWLRRWGFVPTLVERAPAPRRGGYMIDFWGVGYDVAERMRLLPTLAADAYRLEEVRLVDSRGRRVAGFDARVFRIASNDRFLSILRGDLAHRIYDLGATDVEAIFDDTVVALAEDEDGVTVAFERGAARRFDLVVGADGLHSRVRALGFGEEAHFERYLGYYTASFTAGGYPHRDEGAYVSYAVPGGQVARYALRDDRSAFFFVLTRETPLAPDQKHDARTQRDVLQERFAGGGWECDEILGALASADDLYFDAVSQIQMPHWARGRIALVGDAAYCPSLLAGQGSAFAMAGAYVLAHSLHCAGGDHGVAFAAYERAFKPFVEGKQRGARRLGSWFAPRTQLAIEIRNLITNLLGMPLVAHIVARRAFGDRFTLPPVT